jgi:uncharacterized protein YidB (DUF937 family)
MINSVKKAMSSSTDRHQHHRRAWRTRRSVHQEWRRQDGESWVGRARTHHHRHANGKNLGTDIIDDVIKQTGLTREELLARLTKTCPEAVDKLTPDGKIPA